MEPQLETIIKAADAKRAENISVLNISEISIIADYFIIMSAETKRQVQAIANEIIDNLKEKNYQLDNVEGLSEARWVVIVAGDFVVHIFDQESYDFYQLYRLWEQAKQVDVSSLITEN
ncbi:MAG: ribosome silencing factor [Lactobacillaceae bacterium]|jgi:ribosome-associated protein|nr:ribosome silencing factor [Lactobacillaceae bacterium]